MNEIVQKIIISNKHSICMSVIDFTKYFLNDSSIYKICDLGTTVFNNDNWYCCNIVGIKIYMADHVENDYIKYSDHDAPSGRNIF
jgi:hypothetical protein